MKLREAVWDMMDGNSQLAGRGRLNCRRGQAPTLHPGDCLEFVHNTVIPTNRGTIQGTMTMQKWRPGRQSRLDDCFTAAIGPVQLLDLRLPR